MDKNLTIKNNSKSRRGFLHDAAKWIGGTAVLATAANVLSSGKIKADTTSVNGSDVFIGEIIQFATNFAPRGHMFCDGTLLPIASNTALFSLLGTTFGGDGRITMGIPDLRGRVAIGYGNGPGLSTYNLGSKGGVPDVTLVTNQIPSHSHSLKVNSEIGNTDNPSGNYIAANSEGITHYSDAKSTTANSGFIGNTGENQAHNNMQPYLAIHSCISLVGIYPSRS